DTVVNNDWVNKVGEMIRATRAEIVFTHWPVDSHKDHQVASLLTIQAWVRSGGAFDLYFFEVCAGEQTMTFSPTDYVDISTTQEKKRQSVFCHKSQDPDGIYACGHASMEDFRGREIGVKAAEGFVQARGIRHGLIKVDA
ncbi:MAG TPA: PIG-L family deacetylase, partial [Chitinophagaceae bacterium]